MKYRFHVFALLIATHVSLAGWVRAADLTMLVVPERYNLLQVAFDLVEKRPIILVSYRGDATTTEPGLFAWSGQHWIHVSFDDYRRGEFLRADPTQVVIIGDTATVPASLVEASGWGGRVMNVPYMESDEVLNALGRTFEFSPREWRWFARRYNMEIEDLRADRPTMSWYDHATEMRRRQMQGMPTRVEPAPERMAPAPEIEAEPERAPEPMPAPQAVMQEPEPIEEEAPAVIEDDPSTIK